MKIFEDFELPSAGNLYPSDRGKIANMDGIEELERTSPSQWQDSIIAAILDKCMQFDMKAGELCVPDFEYLLMRGGVATYGNMLGFVHVCPNCGEVYRFVDLNEIKIVPFDKETYSKYLVGKVPSGNNMQVKDGDEIEIRLPTVLEKEETRLERDARRGVIKGVMYSIEKVNGKKLSMIDKEIYTERLSQAARRTILSRVDKVSDFGIALLQERQCDKCQKSFTYPFSARVKALICPTVD